MKKNQILAKLGQRIRNIREEKNWSQEKLGEESGLDRTYIGGVERGERNISVLNLHNISKALAKEIKDLFDYK